MKPALFFFACIMGALLVLVSMAGEATGSRLAIAVVMVVSLRGSLRNP